MSSNDSSESSDNEEQPVLEEYTLDECNELNDELDDNECLEKVSTCA